LIPSLLLAYAFARDSNHTAASKAVRASSGDTRIVPAPVLTELFYMVMVRLNYERAIQVFASTRAAFEIAALTESEMVRMQAIMEQYRDARFDYTDTAIMAVSERLNVTKILTFDHRDFSIFRPRHCNFLELLP
jgi:predicted nucleic acid-binding protein